MSGKLLKLVNTILEENWVYIFKDEAKLERIVQMKELAQGDSIDHTMFIMYGYDLNNQRSLRTSNSKDVDVENEQILA